MKPKIVIVGSSNTDMVVKVDHLPVPGETILGGAFFMNPGGKGANQAVAAARLGGNVIFICKTGDDIFGRQSVELFEKEGINTQYILTDSQQPSGVALITVDKKAENCIAVASGANGVLIPQNIESAKDEIARAKMVLMQLEIPIETVEYVAELAHKNNVKVLLNPAPACKLSDELLFKVSIITPNETEAEMLTGIKVNDAESAQRAAQKLNDKGIKTVIITMGSKGAMVLDEGVFTHVPARVVDAIDTTAAGDVFNGALAMALVEEKNILDATTFASNAAAISVSRLGAQSSAPNRKEVDLFGEQLNQ